MYYYDGIRPIWEADGAGAPKVQLDRDIFGNLLSRREVSSGVRRYFAHDGLGGLTGVTDEAGAHVASLFYDAWGNLRASGGPWTAGNYRFTGAELDSATELYHMGVRFYEPGIGRWLSEDPVQDQHSNPQTLNLYAYNWNSPGVFVDPTGTKGRPAQLLLGWTAHASVERWFKRNFPGSVTELRLSVAGLRLDMMKPGAGGVWEVYELKPASVFGDSRALFAARKQLQGYVDALYEMGVQAQAGGSWNPQGTRVPHNHLFDAILTSDPKAPGIIGYTLTTSRTSSDVLVQQYGVDPDIALAVLAILLALATGGSSSPLFQPR